MRTKLILFLGLIGTTSICYAQDEPRTGLIFSSPEQQRAAMKQQMAKSAAEFCKNVDLNNPDSTVDSGKLGACWTLSSLQLDLSTCRQLSTASNKINAGNRKISSDTPDSQARKANDPAGTAR